MTVLSFHSSSQSPGIEIIMHIEKKKVKFVHIRLLLSLIDAVMITCKNWQLWIWKKCLGGSSITNALELPQSCTKSHHFGMDRSLLVYLCQISTLRAPLWWESSGHFVNAPSQWEMTLQCNVISHWLGVFTKWSLRYGGINFSCDLVCEWTQ